MKPRSAKNRYRTKHIPITKKIKGLVFKKDRDKNGISRRRYLRICEKCGKEEWVLPQTISKKRKLCFKCKMGEPKSEELKNRISKTLRKKYTSPSYKEMVKKSQNYQFGEKHWNWKGGISTENTKIRNSFEMKLWRKACFERDNFTCQKTGTKGGDLAVHHINNFADFIELRTSIENGVTLSKESHKLFHHIYGNKNNTKEQLIEFMEN